MEQRSASIHIAAEASLQSRKCMKESAAVSTAKESDDTNAHAHTHTRTQMHTHKHTLVSTSCRYLTNQSSIEVGVFVKWQIMMPRTTTPNPNSIHMGFPWLPKALLNFPRLPTASLEFQWLPKAS